MDEHRLVASKQINSVSFDQPFSSFDYIDDNHLSGNLAIARLFSLARSEKTRTLIVEKIDAAGIIADENREIKSYFNDYRMADLKRISFWGNDSQGTNAAVSKTAHCIGYAILKHDVVPSKGYTQWHIFEAVFKKYPHPHNCVPSPMKYDVTFGKTKFQMSGLLYAQQNGLNKACAQVALRSLISRIKMKDISYRKINDLARNVPGLTLNPAAGLNPLQIQAVLKGLNIKYRDFDYMQGTRSDRKRIPYQKYVYSGIESGTGALVGFRLYGERGRHIIPFYGHTFNKDTWAPDADITYFRVGRRLGYIPSQNWTSSFLGHDDNFGPNFCVPRLYIPASQVEYVVELLAPGIEFGGAQAEAMALKFLYSVLNWFSNHDEYLRRNRWLGRLASNAADQRIVLRAIAIDKRLYIKHLSNEKDWMQNAEKRSTVKILDKLLPRNLYVVEISIPQLFPANERKLGDIVLDGTIRIDTSSKNSSNFVFVRLPGSYLFSLSNNAEQSFLHVPSDIVSHFPLIQLQD